MNQSSVHVDAGDAALHALSALDEVRSRALDRHVANCARCLALLSQAEADVAALTAAQPMVEPVAGLPPLRLDRPTRAGGWLPAWSAAAAILVLAFIPSIVLWQQNRAMHDTMRADGAAVSRLAELGAFRVARFSGAPNADAHVAYANDGSWYVVLVRGAVRPLQVAWMHDGASTMLGAVQPHGDVAMLYLPNSHRMERLALMDGERLISEAHLAY